MSKAIIFTCIFVKKFIIDMHLYFLCILCDAVTISLSYLRCILKTRWQM